MLARDYVIILIIFSVFAGIGALIVTDIASEDTGYDTNISNSNFDSSYNKMEDLTELSSQLSNATTSSSGLGLLGGGIEIIFTATVAVIKLVFDSFSMVNGVFTSMVTSFGIPLSIANIIFPALLSIITVILVFVVISSLTKTKI